MAASEAGAGRGSGWRRLLARLKRGSGAPPQPMTRGARHAFLVLAAAILFVVAASPAFTVVYAGSTAHRQDAQARAQARTIARLNATVARLDATIAQLRAQQLASCAFAADLGSVPLPDKPRPSRVGVSLLADSRMQWRGDHCPGTLPPPSPGLLKWGHFYRIPVS